jgi:hypothetical protein
MHDCHVFIYDLPNITLTLPNITLTFQNITLTQVAYFTGIVGMYRFSATVNGVGVATASQHRLFAILLLLS